MAEWLKDICLTPFRYGMEKIHTLATNAITLIFNQYGRRLFKMDINKLIKSNEYKDDRYNFNLYPLPIKEIDQNIFLNLLRIEEGTINDLLISIPWNAILTEPTIISISNIDLVATLHKNTDTLYLSADDENNSYFMTSKMENYDLINTYKGINTLLLKYFNRINFDIKYVQLKLLNYLTINLYGIKFEDSILSIDKIIIKCAQNCVELAEISGIKFIAADYLLIINSININPILFDHLPYIYTDDSPSTLNIGINIGTLKMEDILANNIGLNYNSENLIINNLELLNIENILLFRNNDFQNILNYNTKLNAVSFNQIINAKISNFSDLIDWLKNFSLIVDKISNRIIVSRNNDIPNKNKIVYNIGANIIYIDDIYTINCKEIDIGRTIVLYNTDVKINDTIGFFRRIIIDGEKIFFYDTTIKSPNFEILSKEIVVDKSNTIFDITFINSKTNNIVGVVNFVKMLSDKITNPSTDGNIAHPINSIDLSVTVDSEKIIEDAQESLLISLNIIDSVVSVDYSSLFIKEIDNSSYSKEENKIIFDFLVKKGTLCITNREAIDIECDILMNNYLLTNTRIKYLSQKYCKISEFKVFIDPEIFDLLNYFIGTLTPENNEEEQDYIISPEALLELQRALENSYMVDSIDEFETEVNNATSNILNSENIKFTQSFAGLASILIENYVNPNESHGLELKVTVELLQIYLFDKLATYGKGSISEPAFLCIVAKKIEFNKIVEQIIEDENPLLIKIVQDKCRSNIITKYGLVVGPCAIIDTTSKEHEWRYFIKYPFGNTLDISVIICNDSYKINIFMNSLTANIREEILIRLLAFFSNSHHMPKQENNSFIEYFNINNINIRLNYSPLILKKISMGENTLSLKNYDIKLSSQIIKYINGFDKLVVILSEKWKNDINPDNILQFIPNIKIIEPYTAPIVYFFHLTSRYFKNPRNKKKIRLLTKKINNGSDLITNFVKIGIDQVYDYFN